MKLILASFLAAALSVYAAEPLSLRAKVLLPGVKGRFDHFAADPKSGRMFVAALGNNTLEVIDARNANRIQSVSGMSAPAGVCYIPDQNLIGVANGGRGTLDLLDGATFKTVRTVGDLDDADNLRFNAARRQIFVGFGSGSIAFIDSQKAQKIAEIKLKSHPESFQFQANGARLFVNVPGADQVAVIDCEKRAVIAEWPLHGFKANFPMSLDPSGKRVFVGCRSPSRLLALDMESGKLLDHVEISGDTDDLFFDSKRNRIYVSCGEGFIDVISVADTKMQRVAHTATRRGARTSFFSVDHDELYLAVPQRTAEPAEIWIYKPE